jgi:hypothetical protein
MARTTPELVGTVIDLEEGDDVVAYIDAASSLVEEVCTPLGYSDARLELIERWLGAHFFDINRPRARLQSVGGGGGTLQEAYEPVTTNLWLNNTKYGQQAMLLDTKGGLAALNNSMKLGGVKRSFIWLGTPAWQHPLAGPP